MTKLINFIDIIAWVSCILSFLLVCIRVHGANTYTVFDEQLDVVFLGVKRVFPIKVPACTFVVSLAWLVS